MEVDLLRESGNTPAGPHILNFQPSKPFSLFEIRLRAYDTTVALGMPILGVSCPFTNITLSAQKLPHPAYPEALVTLGDHIRTRRLDLGLLQKEVAARIGVDSDTIMHWELNRRSPKIQYVPKITRFLGYVPFSMGELFPEKLKAYRKLRGLTQQQLASALGVVLPTVQTWEAGIHQPMPKMRERVLRGLERAFESIDEA